ncbi:MAG TPA: DUF2207 domain-containing protein [bacterium]|nr:DUF2207 domain-containing protein [bacterium]HOR57176.1 DUF2207 domain-containing protein [bacterium]HPL56039.1 DUF2207 domain-containing protein [bacterium]
MKIIGKWIATVSLCLALFCVFFQYAYAQEGDSGWKIEEFKSSINVSEDAVLDITETLSVDFGTQQKHGIYRYIPLNYYNNSGQSYKLKMKVIAVTNANGSPLPYESSGWFGKKTIKIGDPDITVSGKQTYVIRYEIKRGIRFLENDELYWNVTGNDWSVPVESARAEVNFPSKGEALKALCFSGLGGSTENNCVAETEGARAHFSAQDLTPGEGLTVVAGAPKGTLNPPSKAALTTGFLFDNISYFILVLTLIIFYFTWRAHGRDPLVNKAVAPEFAPPDDLTPSMMGVLKDERVDMLDISAGIIQLASRGYITIHEPKKGKDYTLKRVPSATKPLSDFEKMLLTSVFSDAQSKKISELKNNFYVHIPALKSALYNEIMNKGYFEENPNSTRVRYTLLALLLPIGMMFLLGLLTDSITAAIICSIVLSPFALWFGFSMPRKTKEGAEALRQTKGFRMFIYTAERYRARFEEDKNIFSKYLPYAIVFGLTGKWAKAFKGLDVNPPDWYVGSHPFDTMVFAHTLSGMNANMGAALASHPQSSDSSGFGGGFSGGGFGGGGGGSW